MQYIKTKNLTQKKQVLCGLRGIFLLFSCQTPEDVDGNTLYFGADGSQQFSQWVDDGGERYYIDDNGYVVKNSGNTIPSLTVNRRKNRRIPCIYWAAAIFSLLRTIVIYSFPLLFFWIVLILLLVMNW